MYTEESIDKLAKELLEDGCPVSNEALVDAMANLFGWLLSDAERHPICDATFRAISVGWPDWHWDKIQMARALGCMVIQNAGQSTERVARGDKSRRDNIKTYKMFGPEALEQWVVDADESASRGSSSDDLLALGAQELYNAWLMAFTGLFKVEEYIDYGETTH